MTALQKDDILSAVCARVRHFPLARRRDPIQGRDVLTALFLEGTSAMCVPQARRRVPPR